MCCFNTLHQVLGVRPLLSKPFNSLHKPDHWRRLSYLILPHNDANFLSSEFRNFLKLFPCVIHIPKSSACTTRKDNREFTQRRGKLRVEQRVEFGILRRRRWWQRRQLDWGIGRGRGRRCHDAGRWCSVFIIFFKSDEDLRCCAH